MDIEQHAIENLLRRDEAWKRLVIRLVDSMPNQGWSFKAQPRSIIYDDDEAIRLLEEAFPEYQRFAPGRGRVSRDG